MIFTEEHAPTSLGCAATEACNVRFVWALGYWSFQRSHTPLLFCNVDIERLRPFQHGSSLSPLSRQERSGQVSRSGDTQQCSTTRQGRVEGSLISLCFSSLAELCHEREDAPPLCPFDRAEDYELVDSREESRVCAVCSDTSWTKLVAKNIRATPTAWLQHDPKVRSRSSYCTWLEALRMKLILNIESTNVLVVHANFLFCLIEASQLTSLH